MQKMVQLHIGQSFVYLSNWNILRNGQIIVLFNIYHIIKFMNLKHYSLK